MPYLVLAIFHMAVSELLLYPLKCCCAELSHSVVSDPLQPHGLQRAKQSTFLSSVKHSRKLLNVRRGIVITSVMEPVGQKYSSSRLEKWGQSCGTEPLTCGICANSGQLVSDAEKTMAPHSSTLAWKIPWMEEPGRLQSMWSLRVRHD